MPLLNQSKHACMTELEIAAVALLEYIGIVSTNVCQNPFPTLCTMCSFLYMSFIGITMLHRPSPLRYNKLVWAVAPPCGEPVRSGWMNVCFHIQHIE